MILTFPHIGNIDLFMKTLLEGSPTECVIPPRSTKRTLELGVRYAPETACLPLKINLGNFIEAIEKGADTAVITGGKGPCRFGYYGQIEREILNSLGYSARVVILDDSLGIKKLFENLFEIFGSKNLPKIVRAFYRAYKTADAVDSLENLSYKIRPRELEKGKTDEIMLEFRKGADSANSRKEIFGLVKKPKKSFPRFRPTKISGRSKSGSWAIFTL
jgi:Uncharacterized protein conserved in bacteria